ncbi:MAG TPA: RyR domain-containing protein [Pyrinomonadaceae bacterium]|jgi:hypothetical protein
MKIEDAARVCHEANRSLCFTQGDFSQKSWEEAEDWQRQSAVDGVKFTLENPDAPASVQHEAWMREKIDDGWVYGESKDAEKKTHPCIVPYDELPPEQQAKDYLFKGIINGLANFIEK